MKSMSLGATLSLLALQVAIAKARWGETFELKCLEGSRGDTLSDEDILRLLRYFRDHGTVYSRVLA